jgi:hypothetical protein
MRIDKATGSARWKSPFTSAWSVEVSRIKIAQVNVCRDITCLSRQSPLLGRQIAEFMTGI